MAPADPELSFPARVFVYGTLLAGEANHGLLATACFVTAARTQQAFELRDLGAFPGLVAVAGGGHVVVGEVYEVDAPTMVALDQLEDHPAFYLRTRVVLEGGLEVWTYLLPLAQVEHCPVITSGSWLAR